MKAQLLTICLLTTVSTIALADSTQCEFGAWKTYKNTELKAHPAQSAYLFASDYLQIDADGAPNAYHPNDIGLDYLANAGYPRSSWWDSVLVPNPINPRQAFIQPSGPYAGYFVSKTSLQNKRKETTDPERYVDASKIPYMVFPGAFFRMQGTGRLGDLGIAINPANGKWSPLVVADVGPTAASLGEVSVALAESLSGNSVNPKNAAGAPQGKIVYVVFPYSSSRFPWPQTAAEIAAHSEQLLSQVGGINSILACNNS